MDTPSAFLGLNSHNLVLSVPKLAIKKSIETIAYIGF